MLYISMGSIIYDRTTGAGFKEKLHASKEQLIELDDRDAAHLLQEGFIVEAPRDLVAQWEADKLRRAQSGNHLPMAPDYKPHLAGPQQPADPFALQQVVESEARPPAPQYAPPRPGLSGQFQR